MATQDPIRITKYTNRRLYDATNSRHLTLDQLVELIKDGHDVEVIDSKSKEDLTQSVLMQILVEDKGATKAREAIIIARKPMQSTGNNKCPSGTTTFNQCRRGLPRRCALEDLKSLLISCMQHACIDPWDRPALDLELARSSRRLPSC